VKLHYDPDFGLLNGLEHSAATWDDRADEQPTRRQAKSRFLPFLGIARQSACYDGSNNYRVCADSEWIEPLDYS